MKRIFLSLLVVLLLLSVVGCCAEGTQISMALSDKPRETSPDISTSDLAALVDGNSAFAFDLYQALSD
ncbi:MAG: hypothetical protein KAV87_45810, partial [Desulfobacteraceae bacterium]|nr:hypothetical protein [Desulfobacteraceae bacterium]